MNKRGQVWSIILLVGFLFIITSFITIEPFKETLDVVRAGTALNCQGVSTFNQTEFDEQTTFVKLTKRPTCFVTGISMIWFVVGFSFAVVIWVTRNINKLTKK